MAPKKPKPKYLPSITVPLDDETEYVAVVMEDVAWAVNANIGLNKFGGGASRSPKKTVLAHFIKDPDLGLLTPELWAEKKRQQVMGSLPVRELELDLSTHDEKAVIEDEPPYTVVISGNRYVYDGVVRPDKKRYSVDETQKSE